MLNIVRATQSWASWYAENPELVAHVTSVDLGAATAYDVHLSVWGNPDQALVDEFAASLEVESNPGWDPAGRDAHQWAIDTECDGLVWHVTLVTSDPAARTGFASTSEAQRAAAGVDR